VPHVASSGAAVQISIPLLTSSHFGKVVLQSAGPLVAQGTVAV
jgi:hypothetical protein